MALGFAVGSRGSADHNRSGAYEVDFTQEVDRRNVGPEAARLAVETEDKAALMDSLILCKFLRGVFDDFFAESAAMLKLATGWETTAEEMCRTAQRIIAAKKRFNILAGWTPAEDTLPERMLHQPLADDASATIACSPASFGRCLQHSPRVVAGRVAAGEWRMMNSDAELRSKPDFISSRSHRSFTLFLVRRSFFN